MKIGYAKLGRSWNLDINKASTVGGDIDCIRLLNRLSNKYKDSEIILVGRNSAELPQKLGYSENVINPWYNNWKCPTMDVKSDYMSNFDIIKKFVDTIQGTFNELDAIVLWLGQHGGANSPIPLLGTSWDDGLFAKSQVSFLNYCAYLLYAINNTKLEPIMLCPDPRNYIKFRELSRPFKYPCLAQYTVTKTVKHEQFNKKVSIEDLHTFGGVLEDSVWVNKVDYVYSGLEMTALDDPSKIKFNDIKPEHLLGLIVNENQKKGRYNRLKYIKGLYNKANSLGKDKPLIYGSWSNESQAELGQIIEPIKFNEYYNTLKKFKYTWTLPASSSGWLTAKLWECFATGVICFIHPIYDFYNFSLEKYPELRYSLSAKDSDEVYNKINFFENNPQQYEKVKLLCRHIFEEHFEKYNGGLTLIEDRLCTE